MSKMAVKKKQNCVPQIRQNQRHDMYLLIKSDLVEDFNKVTSDAIRVMHSILALPEGWVARKGDGRHSPREVVESSYLDQ